MVGERPADFLRDEDGDRRSFFRSTMGRLGRMLARRAEQRVVQQRYLRPPGALDEVGEGPGRGFTLNLPMPGGLGDQDYSRAYREIVEPVGRAFDPQLILISAGFDAHEDDPLAGMKLTAAGFAEIMDVCVSLASGSAKGRVVAVLEGGYSLEGLASATAASVARLLDRPSPPLRPGTDPRTDKLLSACRKTQTPFWPVLGS